MLLSKLNLLRAGPVRDVLGVDEIAPLRGVVGTGDAAVFVALRGVFGAGETILILFRNQKKSVNASM